MREPSVSTSSYSSVRPVSRVTDGVGAATGPASVTRVVRGVVGELADCLHVRAHGEELKRADADMAVAEPGQNR